MEFVIRRIPNSEIGLVTVASEDLFAKGVEHDLQVDTLSLTKPKVAVVRPTRDSEFFHEVLERIHEQVNFNASQPSMLPNSFDVLVSSHKSYSHLHNRDYCLG